MLPSKVEILINENLINYFNSKSQIFYYYEKAIKLAGSKNLLCKFYEIYDTLEKQYKSTDMATKSYC